jgi:aromatic ring-cleaving dioxygenase
MSDAPYHAHIYYAERERAAAAALRETFIALAGGGKDAPVLFVGRMMDRGVGPHPIPQYEIHFRERSVEEVGARIEASACARWSTR